MLKTELPKKEPHRSFWHEVMSYHEGVHEAIKEFLGFNRDVPAEILDDELIELICATYYKFKDWRQVGKYVKSFATRKERATARAVLMNLSRMKRENGGCYPWEA